MRRYQFKLYPSAAQAALLHDQRMMVADLWNALLQRYEDIQRRTQQRQVWFDKAGNRHVGHTIHRLTWDTIRYKSGEQTQMGPGPKTPDKPKTYAMYDMQNEITHLLNVAPEWRALSVWTAHRTAALLDRAFQAFYRRAKEGSGIQSGYPRYKRRSLHAGIPHRFLSGCKLAKDDRHELSWSLSLKGIREPIHARGTFPVPVTKWTDADVVWRDQTWWVSVAVDVPARRVHGSSQIKIEFDLIDCFARVNGYPEILPDFARLQSLSGLLDELRAIHDQEWPRGQRLSPEQYTEQQESWREVSKLSAFVTRARRNSLHVWTARIINRASDITIIMPELRENTKTPRGNEHAWGAQVETVSELNRNVLEQAPGRAVQMLVYKAEEAGIRCDVVKVEAPKIAVGGDLVHVGKQVRRTRRQIKKEIEHELRS